jgi:hypothetical protein
MKNIEFTFQNRLRDKIILALMKLMHINYSETTSDEEELDFRKFDERTKRAAEQAEEWIKNKDYSKFKTHSEVFE